jgi:Tfp pilus assembly protein PilN
MQLLMNQKNAQLSSAQKQYRDVTDLAIKARDTYQQMLTRLNVPIQYFEIQRGVLNRGLGQVFASLPASMYLTSISDDGSVIVVEGTAPSEEIMLNYSRDLRNSGLFNLVLISTVGTSSYTEVTFTMQLTVKQ